MKTRNKPSCFISFNKSLLYYLLPLLVFLIIWIFLAIHLPVWGDEQRHFMVGKSLSVYGLPYKWDFEKGQVVKEIYERGLVVSRWVKGAYNSGGPVVLLSRIFPLLCNLLAFFLFCFYIRFRQRVPLLTLSIASVLFFGQSFILEQALFVRVYAPLALFFLVAMIFYWEAFCALRNRFYGRALIGIVLSAIFGLVIPMKDSWQFLHIPVAVLAMMLGLLSCSEKVKCWVKKFYNYEYLKKHTLGIVLSVLFFPVFALVLMRTVDIGMQGMQMGGSLGMGFSTYWDNVFALIRFLVAINVCILGLVWPLSGQRFQFDFMSWLYLTGVLSGIIFATLEPFNQIFYSRYLYLSVFLTVLGMAGILVEHVRSRKTLRIIIISYVLINILLSFVNFYFDRSNVKDSINWLKNNLTQDDFVIVFNPYLGLHGGEKLSGQIYPIYGTEDDKKIGVLIDQLERRNQGNVYFLYVDHYEFRNKLYKLTMRENRSPPCDLFRYLKDEIPAEWSYPRLRGCGLLRYQKNVIVTGLKELKEKGYPPCFKAVEKRIIKKLLKFFGIDLSLKNAALPGADVLNSQ